MSKEIRLQVCSVPKNLVTSVMRGSRIIVSFEILDTKKQQRKFSLAEYFLWIVMLLPKLAPVSQPTIAVSTVSADRTIKHLLQ